MHAMLRGETAFRNPSPFIRPCRSSSIPRYLSLALGGAHKGGDLCQARFICLGLPSFEGLSRSISRHPAVYGFEYETPCNMVPFETITCNLFQGTGWRTVPGQVRTLSRGLHNTSGGCCREHNYYSCPYDENYSLKARPSCFRTEEPIPARAANRTKVTTCPTGVVTRVMKACQGIRMDCLVLSREWGNGSL